MRRVVRFALFVGVLALSGVTHASDVDDVKAAAEGWLSDANAQRAKSLVARYHPEETSYGGFGELLSEGVHTVDMMTAFYEAGFKTNLQWRHLDATVVENTGVSTGYLTGSVTMPGGKLVENTWRTSIVWIREAGTWKLVHFHASVLLR